MQPPWGLEGRGRVAHGVVTAVVTLELNAQCIGFIVRPIWPVLYRRFSSRCLRALLASHTGHNLYSSGANSLDSW